MMRRLPGVCLAALAVTLAVAPLASAKPPDLPNNPTIVVAQAPPEGENGPDGNALEPPSFDNLGHDGYADGCKMTHFGSLVLQGEIDKILLGAGDCNMTQFGSVVLRAWLFLGLDPFMAETEESNEDEDGSPNAPSTEASTQQPLAETGCCSGCCFCRFLQANWCWCMTPEACCCGALNQFGLCWMSRLADCWKHCFARGEKDGDAGERTGHSHCAAPCDSLDRLMQTPITVSFEGKPLSAVFDDLRTGSGLPITIDQESLTKAGIASLDDLIVTFHVVQTPIHVALDQLLQPYHLSAEVQGCVVCISAKPQCGEKASLANECGSACPKCEAMHAKYVADAKVTGLMKACYQAVGEGRFKKAAKLAQQAHQLDPARVEGDPLIYKMHLLAQKKRKKGAGKCGGPKPKETPANHDAEDPPLSFHPPLPGDLTIDVVPAMDAILTGEDELAPTTPAPPHE